MTDELLALAREIVALDGCTSSDAQSKNLAQGVLDLTAQLAQASARERTLTHTAAEWQRKAEWQERVVELPDKHPLRIRAEQAERERDALGRAVEIYEGQVCRVEQERDSWKQQAAWSEEERVSQIPIQQVFEAQVQQQAQQLAAIRALAEKWRKACVGVRAELLTIRREHPDGPRYGIAAVESCADDLDALLTPQEPQP